jgi:hypothetical protein
MIFSFNVQLTSILMKYVRIKTDGLFIPFYVNDPISDFYDGSCLEVFKTI